MKKSQLADAGRPENGKNIMSNTLRNSLLGMSILAACAFSNAYATYSYTGCTPGKPGKPSQPGCSNYVWKFDSATSATAAGVTSTVGGVAVNSTASGWWAPNATASMTQDTPLPGITSYGANGIGVTTQYDSTSNGTHGIDNNKGFDLVIFEFDKPITLTEVTFGYVYKDADFQLFAYSGVGDPDGNPLNNNFAYNSTSANGLTNTGWDLLGNYNASNTPGVGTDVSGQTNGIASKYWAIGAYSSSVQGGPTIGGKVTDGNDAFKLLQLCGDLYTPPGGGGGVPEPATVSLLGVGLVGLMRRRKK